ncbi:MAG: hypothetical protein IPO07_23605 [Haliscomenobacter sp.]|nr:hypothetical protein [Haliscomenobacter sp.]
MGRTYFKVDWKTKKIAPLLDQERLAKVLGDSLKTTVKASDLPLQALQYKDAKHLEFSSSGKIYELDLDKYTLKRIINPEWNPLNPSPRWQVDCLYRQIQPLPQIYCGW